MRKITGYVLIAGLLGLPSVALSAPAADTPEARIAATKEYLQVLPAEKMVNDVVGEILKKVPDDKKEAFEKRLRKAVEPGFVEKITLETMPKHFTTDEIQALTRFYGSREGASIMKKFGAYMADLMPAIQQQVVKAFQQQ